MTKVRNFAEITPNLPFTEYNFYEEFRDPFEKTELGRMKKLLPLHEMAKSLGQVSESLRPKRGRRSYFTPEGKVALMFLKMKTQMSFPKLMEALNGNIFYQMFCDIVIDPARPLTNYKLLDDIALDLAGKLKIQELQNVLAEMWKPWMKDLAMYTDATCYESEMRYPTDQKLLWECIEKGYALMCEASLFTERENQTIAVITTVYRQQHNHFRSGDARESIPNRIVSVNKPYVKPIVRGKEAKNVEFGAKCNNILVAVRRGREEDRRRRQLCRQLQPRAVYIEWYPYLVRPEGQTSQGEAGEGLCARGSCKSEGHDDGMILRDAEGTLRDAADQGEDEDDGDPGDNVRTER
ncbi:MAG: hypothetical protein J6O51_06865 [Bacteroidales bacterium]|nr:hypothetical protein [Bacteroidales bacterium]